MENSNKLYEKKLISSLFCVHNRPGLYIGKPSLEKLLDYMIGYVVAVYDLTGYRIVFEQQFRQYLCQKYQKKEYEYSLRQLVGSENNDEEAFEAFFRELSFFCQKNEDL